jgi:uncharacterized protein YcsI (UPF0317 family)
MNKLDLKNLEPHIARQLIREKKLKNYTAGIAMNYTQTNLVVLKKELAFDFLLFCQRNPQSCPILDVTEIGSPIPELSAPTSDLRTDIVSYYIYKNGVLTDQVEDIMDCWEDDMVAFLLGCSNTFEKALLNNGIPVRHIEMNSMVPVYKTNIPTVKAGCFEGPVVVSMRPIPRKDLIRAIQVTTRFPATHGAPIHIGNPEDIGIEDIHKPNYGNAVPIFEDEIPVFWACGVTPQIVAMQVKPSIMITHEPGHMFITDIIDETLTIL